MHLRAQDIMSAAIENVVKNYRRQRKAIVLTCSPKKKQKKHETTKLR